MKIEITQELLDEINTFINGGKLVNYMSEVGLSIEAMTVILQSVIGIVDNFQEKLDGKTTDD